MLLNVAKTARLPVCLIENAGVGFRCFSKRGSSRGIGILLRQSKKTAGAICSQHMGKVGFAGIRRTAQIARQMIHVALGESSAKHRAGARIIAQRQDALSFLAVADRQAPVRLSVDGIRFTTEAKFGARLLDDRKPCLLNELK